MFTAGYVNTIYHLKRYQLKTISEQQQPNKVSFKKYQLKLSLYKYYIKTIT